MKRYSVGRRRTDVLILCGLVLAFPVFCPIPVGSDTFVRVYLNKVPWSFGRHIEHANFGGTGVDFYGFDAGPVGVALEKGVAP